MAMQRENHESKIARVITERTKITTEIYLNAIDPGQVYDDTVEKHTLEEGNYVLLRHESARKFESKRYGPYKIKRKNVAGTYGLVNPDGIELKTLIDGQRLV